MKLISLSNSVSTRRFGLLFVIVAVRAAFVGDTIAHLTGSPVTMVARLGESASFSATISPFETFPVSRGARLGESTSFSSAFGLAFRTFFVVLGASVTITGFISLRGLFVSGIANMLLLPVVVFVVALALTLTIAAFSVFSFFDMGFI